MKTLKTMIIVVMMTIVSTTVMAGNTGRRQFTQQRPQQPRQEQRMTKPEPPRHDDKRDTPHRHDMRPMPGQDNRQTPCPVCHRHDCHTHNFCPTCGKRM